MTPGFLALAARYLAHGLRRLHPFEVQANVTNRCNLKCAFCACPLVPVEEISTADWLGVMTGLRRLGTGRFKFQGGEPTLRPDFGELCAAAKRLGMVTAAVSNCSAIAARPDLCDCLDELIASLDSPREETHDAIRGRGNYRQVVAAIDAARSRGVRVFVNMVITSVNRDQVQEMLALCEKMGVGFNAQPVLFGRVYFDQAAAPSALSGEEVRDLFRRQAEWKEEGRHILFAASTYRRAAAWDDFGRPTKESERRSRCFAGRDHVHIEPNGDVHPCAMHVGRFKAKNILRDGIEQALANAREHRCSECFMPHMNERRALFGFRPDVLWERLVRGPANTRGG